MVPTKHTDFVVLIVALVATSASCSVVPQVFLDLIPTETATGGTNSELDAPPTVRLSADNPTPGISESVTLRCTIVSGPSDAAEFSFFPTSGGLLQNRTSGIATFIVDASDLGEAFSFTCRATNEHGVGPISNAITIIPTG